MNNGWVFRVGNKVVCIYANTYLKATERLREEYGRVEFEFLTVPEATNVEITDYIY